MTYWLPDMTGPEVVSCGTRPIIIPFGSLEQHGSHLPLDTDSAIAESFARGIGDAIGALVAPGISYGYRSQPASGGGEIFTATTSLSGAALMVTTSDVVCAFARHGYRNFAIVNGHFENTAFIVEAANLVVEQHADVKVVVVNWWDQMAHDRLDDIFQGKFPGWEAEHAGIAETSLMMHLHPDRVKADLIHKRISDVTLPSFTILPERPGLVDATGVLRTAHGSSAGIGKNIYTDVLEASSSILEREFGSFGAPPEEQPGDAE